MGLGGFLLRQVVEPTKLQLLTIEFKFGFVKILDKNPNSVNLYLVGG